MPEFRIVSRPDWLYNRAYEPQVKVKVVKPYWPFFWIKKVYWEWREIEELMNTYDTEDKAKRAIEEFAKGSWVSDSATIPHVK